MTPYAGFLYFGILLYVAVPALLLGITGLATRWLLLLATAGMLVVQYWTPLKVAPHTVITVLYLVAGYAVMQLAVALAFQQIRRRTRSKIPFYAALLLGIAPLAVAKYLPLVAAHYVLGFVGISYLTFRSLDVIIGIQDQTIKAVDVPAYLAYLLFFPTISAGPIDRYRRFLADWQRRRTRAEFLQDLDGAVHRIFTGFLYKFILAYLIEKYWMTPIAHTGSFGAIVSYMYAYTFYLFFDFAGYSAFAIGVGSLFGIHTPENFNRPFLSRNIKEFWDRWHISLSWWFRDHIFMRFVMAATKRRWFKNKHMAAYLGFFLTMGVMGIWHGSTWYYIAYGLYHGLLMAGFEWLNRWNKQHKVWKDGLLWRAAGVLITFHFVAFGMLLFSGRLA